MHLPIQVSHHGARETGNIVDHRSHLESPHRRSLTSILVLIIAIKRVLIVLMEDVSLLTSISALLIIFITRVLIVLMEHANLLTSISTTLIHS